MASKSVSGLYKIVVPISVLLTALHIVLPFLAPAALNEGTFSLLAPFTIPIWVGSVYSVLLLIYLSNTTYSSFFSHRVTNEESLFGLDKIRTSQDLDGEDARYTSFLCMSCAASCTLWVDLLWGWYSSMRAGWHFTHLLEDDAGNLIFAETVIFSMCALGVTAVFGISMLLAMSPSAELLAIGVEAKVIYAQKIRGKLGTIWDKGKEFKQE